jgi:TatA/E family protein of Tat protein translocase
MMGLGPQEILIIVLVGIVLFGSRRIPELARSLGQGLKELRRSTREVVEPLEEAKATLEEGKREAIANLMGESGDNERGERTSR